MKVKSYTGIEQSKKLVKFLPIESADMHWQYIEEDNGQLQWFCFPKDFSINQHNTISAWSLSALLDILPSGKALIHDKGNQGYKCICNNIDTYFYDNPVDACYEMIIKLHEQKIL